MNLTIKRLEPADLAYAEALFLFFQIDDQIAFPVIPGDKYIETLLKKTDLYLFVALQDQELIGGLTAYELPMYKQEINELFLYEIAVKPEYRKMGVAKRLIEAIKKAAFNKGIKEMYVGTSTDNYAALKLYRLTGGVADENIAWFVYQL